MTHFVTPFEEDFHHRSANSTASRPWGILSLSWGVSEACCRPDRLTRPCRDPIMSDYSHRPGGSLKLKGGVADGGVKKKYDFCASNHVYSPKYRPVTQEEETVQIPR